MLQALTHQLNDAWTVIAGYRNRSGEIDLVAVGPEGIAAVEIKYLNGVVSCEGDLWFRDKYDKYGNLVEQGLPVADRRGRSPSRQLNETTDTLATFLAQRKVAGHILRVVVLSHPMSRLGTMDLRRSIGSALSTTSICRHFAMVSVHRNLRLKSRDCRAYSKGSRIRQSSPHQNTTASLINGSNFLILPPMFGGNDSNGNDDR